ncbi:hypothetical protein [Priestia endophytica]|uniref:hypothetical protein n=1 Tax=Priestia endophytica TaxID=135735 RepID=UPI000DD0537B
MIEAYWRISGENQFLTNSSQGGEISYESIPAEALDFVQKIASSLNINYTGFDVAVCNGKMYLFEFNVMFGNQGIRNPMDNRLFQTILKD